MTVDKIYCSISNEFIANYKKLAFSAINRIDEAAIEEAYIIKIDYIYQLIK